MNTFFAKLGLPFQENNADYAILDSIDFTELKLNNSQDEFDQISTELASIIDVQSQIIGSQPDLLQSLGHPTKLIQNNDSNLCVMRLGFLIDQNGTEKLIEINSQTPSFWWECETGLDKILEYNSKHRDSRYFKNLKNCLKEQIKLLEIKLGTFLKPSIGFVTCDNEDDIFQMAFVNNLVKELNLTSYSEVLTIDKMDIATNNRVYSLNTDQEFDILFLWYPLEWLVEQEFADQTEVVPRLLELVKKNKIALFNGLQSMVTQNKNLLAYITETQELHPNFVPSYYTIEELRNSSSNKDNEDWIGKPIFGREGKGIFGKDKGKDISGDVDDPYYNDQWYIYQPFIQTSQITFNKQLYNYTLEKWVYKVNGKWKPGGQSLRINLSKITTNTSSWLSLN